MAFNFSYEIRYSLHEEGLVTNDKIGNKIYRPNFIYLVLSQLFLY